MWYLHFYCNYSNNITIKITDDLAFLQQHDTAAAAVIIQIQCSA